MRRCKHGHLLSEANTYIATNGEGRKSKSCKTCRAARNRLAYRNAKLGASNANHFRTSLARPG
jgi:hypothetical protein